MPSAPLPPEKAADVQALADAIRQAIDAGIKELVSPRKGHSVQEKGTA